MFLVGHAVVAFLITYIICRIFKINQGVSFALAMLLGTLPDIDIVLQALKIMPHKTFTHSLIISSAIGLIIFITSKMVFKQKNAIALIYSLAYVQHIMDDVIIGTLNILYPIGNLPITIGISYGSIPHEIVEILLLTIAALITIRVAFDRTMTPSPASLIFRFFAIDKIGYIVLVLSLIVSFVYLLNQMKQLSHLVLGTSLQIALFVLLHLSAIVWISFIILISKHYAVVSKTAVSSK
jgi:hypothetical protein